MAIDYGKGASTYAPYGTKSGTGAGNTILADLFKPFTLKGYQERNKASTGVTSATSAAADKQAADIAKLGGQSALNSALAKGMSEAPNQFGPNAPAASAPASIAAPAPNPVDIGAMFAPLFEQLSQREQQANQRYEANTQQVTNIYGQITGARTADIATTGEAFRRLSDAASARSTAVNTSIDEAEATRLRNNQAALESLGLGALSTAQGDIASQGAATAKNTNQLNAENWQGLLTAMGATAQDIARADVTGFNYRMGEDLGRLRGAREEFADQLSQERAGLVSQQAQATFDYQQAQQRSAADAAAAAQRAQSDANDLAAKQQADALKSSGPVNQTIASLFSLGRLSAAEAGRATNAINEWFANVPPVGGSWNAGSAKSSILGLAKGSLNKNEQDAIVAVFDAMKW
jgi:hypothetical protein